MTYKTFVRSATNWRTFAKARKRTVARGLTYAQAVKACAAYNAARSARQKRRGTMMEFISEK